MSDPMVDRARAWLDGHQVPVDRIPPTQLVRELAAARLHLAAVLAVVGEYEASQRPAACRVMDTDDLDPETGEQWGVEV